MSATEIAAATSFERHVAWSFNCLTDEPSSMRLRSRTEAPWHGDVQQKIRCPGFKCRMRRSSASLEVIMTTGMSA
jgi:hypothetical protein